MIPARERRRSPIHLGDMVLWRKRADWSRPPGLIFGPNGDLGGNTAAGIAGGARHAGAAAADYLGHVMRTSSLA